tara:strand:- start:1063 stop:1239 length:177 start_codon:yes stop_codon:yes gene_type:complete
MHPRERVLELAELLLSKGEKLPPRLLAEAKKLGITLPDNNESLNVKQEVKKDGSDKKS